MTTNGWKIVTTKGGPTTVPLGTVYGYIISFEKPGRVVEDGWVRQPETLDKVELRIDTYILNHSTVRGTVVQLQNGPKDYFEQR